MDTSHFPPDRRAAAKTFADKAGTYAEGHSPARPDAQEAVTEAVAGERERCAKLVESFKTESHGTTSYWGEALAAAIRRGEP